MTDAPLLSIKGVSKRFGAVTALDDVSLEVARGEFFALLGPSGCGKTTLMRLVAGFEAPDAGRIEIAGEDMSGAPPHRRPVNLMFQSYALFPHLSVFENIAFGLRRQGKDKPAILARVAELLEIVKLTGVEKRRPDQLSGGQKQRVALARALAPGPRLLLLDEPLGALDRQLREETQFQLKEIQRKLQTSFVVVTHDQDEALAMADRIAVMRAGRIEQIGAPAEIYERPATRFVASFIGQMNFLPGRIEDGLFVGAFGRLPAPPTNLPDGAKAALAVRPERVAPTTDDGLDGIVEDVAFRGEIIHIRVRLASGEILRVSRGADQGARASIGDRMRLAIAADAAQLFTDER
ncbi:ABC transporter ATP-binding protein [Methylosinus sp. Sm6]|uniref:ABC transporter ATP-binding protein n=1 Tax=Methylosinus sp. Sm6 TaxID=2866948 RepID=UPI001C99D387|nr:ABC transporter ATP-binding protein [Methylosinus sp. Sm6]MBY6241396.1 ABC transporter ATP-binding protein [Methylosinus sp. Sm6]